ncbi:MAG: hypothetical protein GX640_08620 [Fibrobacter sp.]|nr:hypothetical protein [Fibrobacter sp.]
MSSKIISSFYNLGEKQTQETSFFFLEHLLKARADLHMESGLHEYDQEINIYLMGLLNSLFGSDTFLKQKPYISPFDTDIRDYLETHPGLRNEYRVYRDNADFGLVLLGLFLKYQHRGSYHNIVLQNLDSEGRIALYYELAASALSHLQGTSVSLVKVYMSIAEYLPEILQILRQTATNYFDFIQRISDGSLYHLEKEIHENGIKSLYDQKLDEFLKSYAMYKENPTEDKKENLTVLAEELKKLNSKFQFQF